MRWLVESIKKWPRLETWTWSVLRIVVTTYMFLISKMCGVRPYKAVFASFGGKSYSDNPRAISEKLHQLHPEFEIVWLMNNPEEKRQVVPSYVRCVKTGSLRSLRELATARFWIDNSVKPRFLYKGKMQVYIQTWHGDRGFKKILYDSPFASSRAKYIEEDICDLMLSGSDFADRVYRTAFHYSGAILEAGCPRNDKLLHDDEALRESIRRALDLDPTTRVLLYAPTLRRRAASAKANQPLGSVDFHEVLDVLERKTGDHWVCLLRAHAAVSGFSSIPSGDKFMDVTHYEDMNDLLLVADMLVTDYSSAAGDFALLRRPIVLFQDDRDDFVKEDRTFYFDIDKSPFRVAKSQEELVSVIEQLDNASVQQNCEDILGFYGTVETGRASHEVVEYMMSRLVE